MQHKLENIIENKSTHLHLTINNIKMEDYYFSN